MSKQMQRSFTIAVVVIAFVICAVAAEASNPMQKPMHPTTVQEPTKSADSFAAAQQNDMVSILRSLFSRLSALPGLARAENKDARSTIIGVLAKTKCLSPVINKEEKSEK